MFILQKNINFRSYFSKIHFFLKVKRGVSIDFFKKNNFSKNIIADKKNLKKKFYAFPLLPKIEFSLYFSNLVPVLSVQKNGEKNSKKRLLFDLSGS